MPIARPHCAGGPSCSGHRRPCGRGVHQADLVVDACESALTGARLADRGRVVLLGGSTRVFQYSFAFATIIAPLLFSLQFQVSSAAPWALLAAVASMTVPGMLALASRLPQAAPWWQASPDAAKGAEGRLAARIRWSWGCSLPEPTGGGACRGLTVTSARPSDRSIAGLITGRQSRRRTGEDSTGGQPVDRRLWTAHHGAARANLLHVL